MLFTPKLIAHNNQGSEQTLNSGGVLGQRISVIARSECHFRVVKLQGPGRAAVQAAEMKAIKEARAGENRFNLIVSNDRRFAAIWSYSDAQELYMRTLPESLCYQPLNDGARLLQCINGVEGQVWQNNELVGSRWWPQDPDERQWQAFLRVAPHNSVDPLPPKPAPITAQFRSDLPVFKIDSSRAKSLFEPAKIATAALIAGTAVTTFLSAQYLKYGYDLKTVESKKTEISQEARQTLAKRRRALATMAALQDYTQFNPQESLLSGMHSLSNVVGGQNAKLRSVKLNDGEVEFILNGEPNISGPDLVAALEETPALHGVNISTGFQNSFSIKARLAAQTKGAQ